MKQRTTRRKPCVQLVKCRLNGGHAALPLNLWKRSFTPTARCSSSSLVVWQSLLTPRRGLGTLHSWPEVKRRPQNSAPEQEVPGSSSQSFTLGTRSHFCYDIVRSNNTYRSQQAEENLERTCDVQGMRAWARALSATRT